MLRIHEDIGYVIHAVNITSHYVEYEIYELMSVAEDGTVLFKQGDNHTHVLEDAAVYAHGSVKWDGCSNWYWNEQDDCMLHGCSQQDLLNLGEVLSRCWTWTAELLKTFEGVRV